MESNSTVVSDENLKSSVINMAVESWRFGRVFERILTKLDAGEKKRYQSQCASKEPVVIHSVSEILVIGVCH